MPKSHPSPQQSVHTFPMGPAIGPSYARASPLTLCAALGTAEFYPSNHSPTSRVTGPIASTWRHGGV